MRITIGGLGMEPTGPRLADQQDDTPSEVAARPIPQSITGGSDSLTVDGPVTDNGSNVNFFLHLSASSLTHALFLGH